MVIAKVKVNGAHAAAVDKKTVTAGMVGAQVQLDYTDPVWDGLHKTVVFYGAAVKDIVTDDTVVTIPAEVLEKPNVLLTVGVYGVDMEGCIVIPTLLAEIGQVRVGTNPSGDATTNPTLPVWAQVQQMLGTLSGIAEDAGAAAAEARGAAGEANQLVEDIQQMLADGELKGDRGDVCFSTFSVSEDDGHLYLFGSENVDGVTFAINESGNLEVSYG